MECYFQYDLLRSFALAEIIKYWCNIIWQASLTWSNILKASLISMSSMSSSTWTHQCQYDRPALTTLFAIMYRKSGKRTIPVASWGETTDITPHCPGSCHSWLLAPCRAHWRCPAAPQRSGSLPPAGETFLEADSLLLLTNLKRVPSFLVLRSPLLSASELKESRKTATWTTRMDGCLV